MNIEKSAEIGGLLQEALQYHRSGQVQKAEQMYRRVLALDPDNGDANHLLGLIACQFGKNDIGISLIRRAIQSNPGSVGALLSLGNALMSQGDMEGAVSSYQSVLAIKPDFAEAHNNLGNALASQGDIDGAAASYRKALAVKPDYAEAYNNLGNLYNNEDSLDAAIANYRHAIAIKPDYAEAYNNLGTALSNLGDLDGATAALHKAISLAPDYAEAYNNLGNLFKKQYKLDEAVMSFNKAFHIKADFAQAYNNLSLTLMSQGKIDEAIASYKQALDIDLNLSETRSNYIYGLHYHPNISQETIFRESEKYDRQHTLPLQPENPVYENSKQTGRRLRIGYISPDFRTHSVNYFFEPFLQARNKNIFEVYLYANVANPDHVTERLQAEADQWHSIVGMKDADIAEQIRRDRIDILVDLSGHTANNRLLVFGYRPAPVQVSWLGYPNTTGLSAMDYRLVDELTDPWGELDHLHSEELVRLEHGFFCFAPTPESPDVMDSPVKRTGKITFGSVNNLVKINGEVINLWSEILSKVKDSCLLINGKEFADEDTRQRYLELFAQHDIGAERLEFVSFVPHLEFLNLLGRIDIVLDPFPYNGHTATCHSLWMGVPVITLLGRHHVARHGASILKRIGLEELVAGSREEYVSKAVELAADRERLAELRSGMRARVQSSSLCDAKTFTRSVEDAYLRMWEKYVQD